jgi:hypothetical protein
MMDLISVYTAAGQLEAEILKSFLESQGLQVILNQESVGRTYGLSAGTLGMVDVLVSQESADEARELLQAMNEGQFDDSGQLDLELPTDEQDNSQDERI